ncbi:hypothetical protein [Amphiplicatus metriothermophilus]|uniref:Uncharacterized protein n=1 Tax=Amphiplicatus metriothermophilus TaxID=1519374 RepID=A0A239PW39_9PROT|nr:hypothetical protein [Amphiplicatus metriothermophilus]MBB5518945.1 hypothetical protein [Amphiplicatus metriothermophilus]SNT74519.1 hypothetical protein SAMN06297382_2223 [Amphiplicatus metriothermophilus]
MIVKSACAGVLLALVATSGAAQDETREAGAKRAIGPQIEAGRLELRPELLAPQGAELECAAFAEDLWSYVNARRGTSPGDHRIGAKMAAVKIRSRDGATYPWGHGAYSEGAFGWGGDRLIGRFTVLYSDRRAGLGARFDAAQADIQDVTLHKDGRVEIMLRSWGNAVIGLEDVRCYGDGFLAGIAREGNGVSIVSFALRKEIITPDSHPAKLWP